MNNRVEVDQLLSQMRAMRQQAQGIHGVGNLTPGIEKADNNNADFSGMLKSAVDKVNDTQMQAGKLKSAFEQGDPNIGLTEVMIASQKASLSFQAMNQVRNKLVSAYQDIMNMPI